jgi:hypothetical protein
VQGVGHGRGALTRCGGEALVVGLQASTMGAGAGAALTTTTTIPRRPLQWRIATHVLQKVLEFSRGSWQRTPELADLISGLLERDLRMRLRYANGADKIRATRSSPMWHGTCSQRCTRSPQATSAPSGHYGHDNIVRGGGGATPARSRVEDGDKKAAMCYGKK